MRTTLTLDPDVVNLVTATIRRQQTSMRRVINDALRRALVPSQSEQPPFSQRVHHAKLRPGFDLTGFNRLVDEFEDEAIMDAARKRQ